MTSAYFASLVTLPVVITDAGEYVTRSGETVTIHTVSSKHEFGCYGMYSDGVVEHWHRSGRISASYITNNDIVRAATRNPLTPKPS